MLNFYGRTQTILSCSGAYLWFIFLVFQVELISWFIGHQHLIEPDTLKAKNMRCNTPKLRKIDTFILFKDNPIKTEYMATTKSFQTVLNKFRSDSFSERDKGDRFERLIQAYLQTDPNYAYRFKNVWLWNNFPYKSDFGGKDTGIDLVALTNQGEFWAIQCKCYEEGTRIDKAEVDSFLSTSSKKFNTADSNKVSFTTRLWVSTTNNWGDNAEQTIKNQDPAVTRINLTDLEQAPVDWGKLEKGIFGEESRLEKKTIREHQQKALTLTHEHFKKADRGKLIMACGSGKTFTALKIAENETKGKGLILFLVPSIALLSQSLREWTAEAEEPINAICICSDSGASRQQKQNEDSDGFSVVDLALPATTDVKKIKKQFEFFQRSKKKGMTVVFSTYQSIEVIAEAQKAILKDKDLKGEFDLIICDEAHRTTGVTLADSDESAFVKVHNNKFIKAKKRIYMTATPRLFNADSKSKAEKADAVLCSMDDESIYGEEMYRIGFGEAVDNGLLTDYKVLVLTISDTEVPEAIQKMIADKNFEINTDDASKFIGCINALSKQILGDEGVLKDTDPEPMRRAVAFCSNIKDSKKITSIFNQTREAYLNSLPPEKSENIVQLNSDHVDGTMSAPLRDAKLSWLKAETDNPNECRILTNARCLSEGVDVPSLDAVLFLSARNSQVDVVQSVGRVMRKAPNKKYGYIIIPVVIPSAEDASDALDNNDRYRVVWTVLNALRAHDDRFNATINQIDLNKKKPSNILVGRPDTGRNDSNANPSTPANIGAQLAVQFEQLQSVVFAKMVQKVGDKRYWEQWAKDVAKIAERYITRINRLINEQPKHKKAFASFLNGLQKNINPSITQEEAVDMLSQHIITKPVFEALFEGYSFVQNNPISVSMQKMLDILEDESMEKDAVTLQKFYESVKMRASKIDNADGKQKIIIELYDKFFKTAFPKMVEKLGIVYTPIECVDFIIHSVEYLLQKEFGRSISDENVHLLDPFTGTGTFITRLLQSGLIKTNDLSRKYENEIHANEIVLLAYYIAAINIENAFHDAINAKEYKAFDGICLTDTFQLGESDESEKMFSEMFPQNSARVKAQKKAPLRVILGNPPYSIGQKSANDNAQNQSYPILDSKIAKTYAKESVAGLNKALYDAYIKSFRWSTDRLDPKNGGIIAFISNGGWLESNSTDGFRKTLEKEFTSIYVFNLRGNARTQGELRRKESGNVFGGGTRTPITITFLIKKPNSSSEKATIHYHDIGDYLTQNDKLGIIKDFGSVADSKLAWNTLSPNSDGDWVSQRNDVFGTYIPIEPEKKYDANSQSFFAINCPAVSTGRDSWVYNFSKEVLKKNMKRMIAFYNEQQLKYTKEGKKKGIDNLINTDSKLISWTVNLKNDLMNGVIHKMSNESTKLALYRPFCKNYLYFNKPFIERTGLSALFFPTGNDNLVIALSSSGSSKGLTLLMTNTFSDYHFAGDTQCFPLYYFEKVDKKQGNLFESSESKHIRRDGISDFILSQAKKVYGNSVDKQDVFYYVYGILHSSQYRSTFEADLTKMLPRIPLVEDAKDFWAFSKAGRKLSELHLNYEQLKPYKGVVVRGDDSKLFSVEKMRFPKKDQKDVIIFNSKIVIENIPTVAYDYMVNGKSAIEWIMERYQVTTNKDSGIKNDPNAWGEETANPRYILDLLLSIISMSVQTVEIVKGLPTLKI